MSFFTMAFMGMVPFGSFLAGTLADIIGPRETLLLGAACCLTGTVMFALHLKKFREIVRPVYINMGIIKEVTEGMETAAEKPPLRKS